MWRPRHEDSIWAAPVRQVAGALQSAQHSLQQGAQGCVEAVQATGRAAVGGVQGGVQRATTVLVAPVHAARAAVQRLVSAFVSASGVRLILDSTGSTVHVEPGHTMHVHSTSLKKVSIALFTTGFK
jgi:hypothetical protein